MGSPSSQKTTSRETYVPLKKLVYKSKESERENSRNSIEKPRLDCKNPVGVEKKQMQEM